MQLDLSSIHEKAWLASALSLAASRLSSSVISLGSAKLSVDSVGDGMTDEGGVVEEREEEDDSLMLTIILQWCLPFSIRLYLYSFKSGPAKQNPVKFTIGRDRHVEQSFRTKMTNNTYPMCVDEVREWTTPITVI
jgi:hypothetical protein